MKKLLIVLLVVFSYSAVGAMSLEKSSPVQQWRWNLIDTCKTLQKEYRGSDLACLAEIIKKAQDPVRDEALYEGVKFEMGPSKNLERKLQRLGFPLKNIKYIGAEGWEEFYNLLVYPRRQSSTTASPQPELA